MKFNSGFGYDNNTKKFTAPDEVWDKYCQAYLRQGNCPDYYDLGIAVGNGVAVGKNSIGLSSATDVRTLGVDENRAPHIEDLDYDAENEAFVGLAQDDPPSSGSKSPLVFPEVSEVSTQRRAVAKRSRAQFDINFGYTENSSHHDFMSEVKKITNTFDGVHSLLEKRETMLEKRQRERSYTTWDAIKEILNLDDDVRMKAFDLLDTKTKKYGFLKMTVAERARWIAFKIKD
ncbi:uncharacterized protein At2g29880-like [Salvia miltiorrhiza]|uniref:uncharacterized protein At2g29880-like n=1 Tax=Salvia miltiorrhiza TaxID=226208 RepID=UPI0025AD2120|nr:uncharacterized protein At2g29880-like [Salvia miltiorrhiza]